MYSEERELEILVNLFGNDSMQSLKLIYLFLMCLHSFFMSNMQKCNKDLKILINIKLSLAGCCGGFYSCYYCCMACLCCSSGDDCCGYLSTVLLCHCSLRGYLELFLAVILILLMPISYRLCRCSWLSLYLSFCKPALDTNGQFPIDLAPLLYHLRKLSQLG